MVTETQTETQESQIIDLGFEVSEADVQRPVLQGGNYDLDIVATREEKSRVKGTPMLVVVFRTTTMAKDTQNREVNPGFTLTQRWVSKPTGGLTKEMIKRGCLGQIQVAVGGAGKAATTDQWIGKTVRCRVNLREPHTDAETGSSYGESNEIVRISAVK